MLFCFISLFVFSFLYFVFLLQQLEKEIAAGGREQKEQDKRDEENARDDDVGDHPF